MTARFNDEAERRDEDFIKALCYSIHRDLLRELHEWIQRELVVLINEAQIQEIELGDPVAEGIKEKIERMQAINQRSLPNATGQYSQVIKDISDGAWNDAHDAYIALQKECSVLVNFVEELVDIRRLLAPMAGNQVDDGDEGFEEEDSWP